MNQPVARKSLWRKKFQEMTLAHAVAVKNISYVVEKVAQNVEFWPKERD